MEHINYQIIHGSDGMTKSPNEIPWEQRNVKYIFPGNHLIVEEVISPWDLLVESRYIGSILGTLVHQIAVQRGLERIFSIRQARNRLPLADILTRPVGARVLLPYWEHCRGLQTSNTFSIDGQNLLVIDVLKDNKRAPEPILRLAREFFTGRGGVLGWEHPTSCVLTKHNDLQNWMRIYSGKWTSDLLCGDMPEDLEKVPVDPPRTTQVLDVDEALILMRIKYFKTIFLDVREKWIPAILDHLLAYPEDKPKLLFLFPGDHPKCDRLLQEARQVMKKCA
jgi:hypothetical protein